MSLEWILSLAAFATSTLSGTVGLAGGAVLLGLMVTLGMTPMTAIPVHAGVQLVSNLTRSYAYRDHLYWRSFGWMFLASLPGIAIGIWLIGRVDARAISLLIAFAILYATWVPKWGLARLSESVSFAIAGFLGSSLGVLVGCLGVMVAPFFLRPGFSKEKIIGTQALCVGYLHLIKIFAFSSVGFSFAGSLHLMLPMAIASVFGAFLGRWLLDRISDDRFVLIYKSVLTLLALYMIYDEF